ncbi:hypothetical protein L1049_026270 [Liquidambar formosana]|uniref:Uncharacterized protein n=1 Tax=Liquidambar formosana TaxID=63359 RepID=A0AAP0R7C7_LIQFO
MIKFFLIRELFKQLSTVKRRKLGVDQERQLFTRFEKEGNKGQSIGVAVDSDDAYDFSSNLRFGNFWVLVFYTICVGEYKNWFLFLDCRNLQLSFSVTLIG